MAAPLSPPATVAAPTEDLLGTLQFDFADAIEALDHHVAVSPGRPAVYYGETGERLDYGEFGARTDALAGNLVAAGITPGERVGVLSVNPLVATLLMYASWKCGGVYAPVNYLYQDELLAYVIRDSAPRILVVDAALLPAYEAIVTDLVQPPRVYVLGAPTRPTGLETTPFDDLLAPASRPDHRLHFADAASIIYTSGTTGPSKGVVQSHRWLTAYNWIGRRFFTPDDVAYNDLPMYHIGGAHWNVARTLWVGASVAMWNRFSPGAFWDRIREAGCTSAALLDVMTPWLLNVPPSPSDRDNTLNKVHLQPLPTDHNAFARRFGIDFVTCAFAQSESGNSLAALIEEMPEGEGTPAEFYRGMSHAELRGVFESLGLPIMSGDEPTPKGFMGRPGLFTDVDVVDEFDEPCATDEVGELVLRSRLPFSLFSGYLEKPAATAHATRNLWFHTGDAAFRRPDGSFCFVDRLGDRIRVRGENISGYHVEELLSRHEAVSFAAVVAVPSAEGSEDDIVAFVELADGASFDEAALAEHCEQTMPRFMRPRRILHIGPLPRTATNKVEKYKLRARFLADERG